MNVNVVGVKRYLLVTPYVIPKTILVLGFHSLKPGHLVLTARPLTIMVLTTIPDRMTASDVFVCEVWCLRVPCPPRHVCAAACRR